MFFVFFEMSAFDVELMTVSLYLFLCICETGASGGKFGTNTPNRGQRYTECYPKC